MFEKLVEFKLQAPQRSVAAALAVAHANDNPAGRPRRRPAGWSHHLVCRWSLDETDHSSAAGKKTRPPIRSSALQPHTSVCNHPSVCTALSDIRRTAALVGLGIAHAPSPAPADEVARRHVRHTDGRCRRSDARRHHRRKGRLGLKRAGSSATRRGCGRQSRDQHEKADAAH